MSLTNAMQIGRSALTASQLGLQVTGNNIANVATPGYSRQVATLFPMWSDGSTAGLQIGQGVGVRDVRRQIDSALQARLWTGVSDEASAQTQAGLLASVEATLGELGTHGLSSELNTFFSGWSEMANNTKSPSLVVQQGDQIASFLKRMRSDLLDHRKTIDQQLGAMATKADDLLTQIAALNSQISSTEVDGSNAGSLRDQRDITVTELSKIMDVTAVEQPGGSMDILVGSTPVVLGGLSRGLELVRRSDGEKTDVFFQVKEDSQRLDIASGQAGSLLASRDSAVDGTIEQLDTITAQLIFEINKLHSTGANTKNPKSSTGTLKIGTNDRTKALNDPTNQTFGGLPFKAVNGGFLVTVKQSATGSTQTVRVDVDLDGKTNTGAAGTGDDTTPEQLRSALDSVPGLHATFNADGQLEVKADDGYEFSFGDDSSGALAVLGMNAYFTGTSAADIGVREDLKADPSQLLTGRYVDGSFVENGTALEVVKLQDRSLSALGDRTIHGAWKDAAQSVGVAAGAAKANAEASSVVRGSLESQRAGVSGVSLDEESINLLNYQRQYQGAARLITVADEMMQTLMQLV